ncbi:kinase-like protein [Phlegmacium glaucopus]|nr:kinase-like protein [Phlegmacium glaucopus]
MDLVQIDGRYRLQRKLGSGSFAEIYAACDIFSGKDIAVKLELLQGAHGTLEHEFDIYKKLAGGTGIPFVHSFGVESSYNVMDLFVHCHFQFSIKTILLLASQLICCLRYIHSRNFIHRDLKPSNIIMGVGKHTNTVYIIDFGLSKAFRNPNTYLHIPYNGAQGLVGTATFASIHSHLGFELGRRDDLESLAYILIYFLRGSLLWQGLALKSHDLVVESKQATSAHVLCQGLPEQLHIFLEYSHSLSFDDKPDYNYLYNLFNAPLLRDGFRSDLAFDWNGSDDRI